MRCPNYDCVENAVTRFAKDENGFTYTYWECKRCGKVDPTNGTKNLGGYSTIGKNSTGLKNFARQIFQATKELAHVCEENDENS